MSFMREQIRRKKEVPKRRISHVFPLAIAILLSVHVDAQVCTRGNVSNTPLMACPSTFTLILDESASIGNNETNVENAARAFIQSLNGLGASIRIIEFASNAREAVVGGSTGFQTVDSTYLSTLNSYLDGINATPDGTAASTYRPAFTNSCEQFTNWEDAMLLATSFAADYTLFFTDGNPTAFLGTSQVGSATPSCLPPNNPMPSIICSGPQEAICIDTSLCRAVEAAISLMGVSFLQVVGISGFADVNNLNAISSDVQTGDFADLVTTFEMLSAELCASELGITKTANLSSICPGDQVTFTITVEDDPTDDNTNDAGDVVIVDTVPADWTIDETVPANGVDGVSISGNVVTRDVGTLVDDGMVTLTITATAPNMVGVYTNIAYVTSSNADSVAATATVTTEDTEAPDPDCQAIVADVVADGSCAGVVPNVVGLVSALDNCSDPGDISITQSPMAGTAIGGGLGTKMITLTFTDEAGNDTTCNVSYDFIDATPPTFTCPNDVDVMADANCMGIVPDLLENINAMDNCGPINADQMPAAGTMFSVDTIVVITVTDGAGNPAGLEPCEVTVTAIDMTAPTIMCGFMMPALVIDMNCQAMLPNYTDSATVSDNCDDASAVTLVQTPAAGTPISATTMVKIVATDMAGNQDSCEFSIDIVDNIDPVVTCPADQEEDADANCMYMLPDYTSMASATDNCPGDLPLQQIPAAGMTVGLGMTMIEIVATDASGNTDTCAFMLTVEDNTPPTLTCPSDTVVSVDPAECQAIVDFAATAMDNCTVSPAIMYSQSPGTAFPVGTTTVTVNAMDAAGNPAIACSFDVTVVDNEAPTAVCMPTINGFPLGPDGTAPIMVSDIDGGSTDNCGIEMSFVRPDVIDCSMLNGATSLDIELVVVDSSGNRDSCMTTVNLDVDAVTDTLICPADVYLASCLSQSEINSQFQAWIGSFILQDPCGDQSLDLSGVAPPDACGDTVVINLDSIPDGCTAFFGVEASPNFSLNIPSDVVVPFCASQDEADALFNTFIAGFSAMGGCTGFTDSDLSGMSAPLVCDGASTMTVVYSADDGCTVLTDSATFTVSGFSVGVINGPASTTIDAECENQAFIDAQFNAWFQQFSFSGGCSPQIPSLADVTSPRACGGTRFIQFEVVDVCSTYVVEASFTVTNDDEAPVVTVPADTSILFGEDIPPFEFTTADNCGVVRREVTIDTIFGECPCEFEIVRSVSAGDGCANETVKTQRITVFDNVAPVITAINPTFAAVGNGGTLETRDCTAPAVSTSDFSSTDNCGLANIFVDDRLIALNTADIFGYVQRWVCTYEAIDPCGNRSEFKFFVEIYDETSPVLDSLPSDLIIPCDDTIPPVANVIASDDCDIQGALEFSEDTLGATSGSFSVIRRWRVVDNADNLTTHTQVINVCDGNADSTGGEMGSLVWMDDNSNGLQDGDEKGVNDVMIYLYKDMDPSQMEFSTPVAITETKSLNLEKGYYNFDYVPEGTYMLYFEIPENLSFTYKNFQDTFPDIDSDVDPEFGLIRNIEVVGGQRNWSLDAGLVESPIQTVSFTSFNANSAACLNYVSWSVRNEELNEYFEIQRSNDGQDFQTIASLNSGNDFGALYTFTDATSDNAVYYRIMQVSLDGTTTMTDVKRVDPVCAEDGELEIEVYPNPTFDYVKIDLLATAAFKDVSIEVYNMLGQSVKQLDLDNVARGPHSVELDLQELQDATYWIVFRNNDTVIRNIPVVKTH